MSDETPQYICESCERTTPVGGKECPSCGGKLVSLSEDEKEPADDELSEEGLAGEDFSTADAGTQSLEALADDELEEDDQSYRQSVYGNDDE